MLRLAKKISRIILGALMIIAAFAHLVTHRTELKALVPDWVPIDKDLVMIRYF